MTDTPAQEQRTDVNLVLAARSGEHAAFGTLAQRWFDRCWDVAWRILRDSDHAADVAQDTMLKAWHQLDRLDQPASFGGWVLRIARNRALDRLEKERRAVPTADDHVLEPRGDDRTPVADPEREFSHAHQHDLVWAAAAALGERDASMLDLHLRHGLEPNELADELGIEPNAARQKLFRMRNRLGDAIRAWLVWRDGTPRCVALRAELAAAKRDRFTAEVARLISRHIKSCDVCTEQRDKAATPMVLFSSVPFVVPPPDVRADAFEQLANAGVPVGDAGPFAAAPSHAVGAPTMHLPVTEVDAVPAPAPPAATGARNGPAWWTAAAALIVVALVGVLWFAFPATDRPERLAEPEATTDAPALPTTQESTAEQAVDEPEIPEPQDPPEPPPPPPAPEITLFEVTLDHRLCEPRPDPADPASEVDLVAYLVTWESTDADAAMLTVSEPDSAPGDPQPFPPNHRAPLCAASGSEFTLEVTGPGGADQATTAPD